MFKDLIEKRSISGVNYGNLMSFDLGDTQDVLAEPTYYKAIKIISESIGKISCNLKQETERGVTKAKHHYLFDLIKNRPNAYMSAIDIFKTITINALHRGDGFLLIVRDNKGKVTNLYPIIPTNIVIDNVGLIKSRKQNAIIVNYTDGINGQVYTCKYSDVIHLKYGISFDGINTTAVKDNLRDIIDANNKAQKVQSDLFENGLMGKLVVTSLSDIRDERKLNQTMQLFTKLYNSDSPILPVPAGFNVSPVSLSLRDSQFTDIKSMTAKQICSAFNLPLHLVNELSDMNNNSLEISNLFYLSDCLMIIFKQLESELNYKLLTETERRQGYFFEFNIGEMLKSDLKTQQEIICNYTKSGIYTIDDARQLLGLEKLPDGIGNNVFVASGSTTIEQIINGEVSYINKNSSESTTTDSVSDKSANSKGGESDG